MCNRQYHTVNQIGVGDNVEYQKSFWQVIINYISGETDKTGYTPLFIARFSLMRQAKE